MIARPKMSRNERKPTEIRASKVGKFARLSCPGEIGPFQSTYGKNTEGIKTHYDKARTFHDKGIKMLQKDFGYHRLFKHPGDTFSAVPFRPKRLS